MKGLLHELPTEVLQPVKDSWKRSIVDKARHQGKTRKILHFPAQLGSDKALLEHIDLAIPD